MVDAVIKSLGQRANFHGHAAGQEGLDRIGGLAGEARGFAQGTPSRFRRVASAPTVAATRGSAARSRSTSPGRADSGRRSMTLARARLNPAARAASAKRTPSRSRSSRRSEAGLRREPRGEIVFTPPRYGFRI